MIYACGSQPTQLTLSLSLSLSRYVCVFVNDVSKRPLAGSPVVTAGVLSHVHQQLAHYFLRHGSEERGLGHFSELVACATNEVIDHFSAAAAAAGAQLPRLSFFLFLCGVTHVIDSIRLVGLVPCVSCLSPSRTLPSHHPRRTQPDPTQPQLDVIPTPLVAASLSPGFPIIHLRWLSPRAGRATTARGRLSQNRRLSKGDGGGHALERPSDARRGVRAPGFSSSPPCPPARPLC